jgi:hypothetical protein
LLPYWDSRVLFIKIPGQWNNNIWQSLEEWLIIKLTKFGYVLDYDFVGILRF